MNTRKIWLDLTTSCNWRRPPVGIVRAEAEILRHLLASPRSPIGFCRYFKAEAAFGLIEREQALLISHGAGYSIKRNIINPESTPGKNDIYLTMGLDWDDKNYTHLHELKKQAGFKVATFCYDLIPVLFPHLCVGDVAPIFATHFTNLAWVSDHVFCISENSRNDLLGFLKNMGAPIPETSVIKLGCNLPGNRDARPAKEIQEILDKDYILFVSTIERRKNHETIYKAITRIVGKGGKAPHVVFVGMRGWGVSDLLEDLRLDPRILDKITILNHVGDADLRHLYQHALFTVYPSLYEGWGLPVSESLALGKFCLASDAASIPEAGEDFAEYIDPYDVPKWAERIQFYTEHRELLESKEKAISANYIVPKWGQAGDHILNVLCNLGEPHCDNRASQANIRA